MFYTKKIKKAKNLRLHPCFFLLLTADKTLNLFYAVKKTAKNGADYTARAQPLPPANGEVSVVRAPGGQQSSKGEPKTR